METERTAPAATGKSATGAEKATGPVGTARGDEPAEKVTGREEPGTMADTPEVLLAARATVTAVMGRSEPPKLLEICSRMVGAARPTLTVWRRVASTRTEPVWFSTGG